MAMRKTRLTKAMESHGRVDTDMVRAHTPSVPGGRTIAVWHRHTQRAKTDIRSVDVGDGLSTEVSAGSPTVMLIEETDGTRRTIACESPNHEMWFRLGLYPVAYREATFADHVVHFIAEAVHREEVKSDDVWETVPPHHRIEVKDAKGKEKHYRLTEVPAQYDGLMPGDVVVGIMGGSGSSYLESMRERAERIGASVRHAAPIYLDHYIMERVAGLTRDASGEALLLGDVRRLTKALKMLGETVSEEKKAEHKALLAKYEGALEKVRAVASSDAALEHLLGFYKEDTERRFFSTVRRFHAEFAHAGECYRSFRKAEKARIARQLALIAEGKAAVNTLHNGDYYPVGGFDQFLADYIEKSTALQALRTAENEAKATLSKALAVDGIADLSRRLKEEFGFFGPRIFGALCAEVGVFGRFATKWKFAKFAGVHVNDDGSFVRRGHGLGGAVLRQEIWLMVGLIDRQLAEGEKWRDRLNAAKTRLREMYPEPLVNEKTGKTRFGPMHIKKTAEWKIATDIAHTIYQIGKDWEYRMRVVDRERLGQANPVKRQKRA